ncbi:MAG: YqcC family protein [Pontibacterium sp.]
MNTRNKQTLACIAAIKTEMKAKDLWQTSAPSEQALASQQPFCVDTLTFLEWVQWLMIPRLTHMIERNMPLPQQSDIYSMAEEALKLVACDTQVIANEIKKLDQALTVHH